MEFHLQYHQQQKWFYHLKVSYFQIFLFHIKKKSEYSNLRPVTIPVVKVPYGSVKLV